MRAIDMLLVSLQHHPAASMLVIAENSSWASCGRRRAQQIGADIRIQPIIRGMIRDGSAVKDLTQNAFLRAARLPEITPRPGCGSGLARISAIPA